jgi:hypothetical protein
MGEWQTERIKRFGELDMALWCDPHGVALVLQARASFLIATEFVTISDKLFCI